jgi:hypothetical protein
VVESVLGFEADGVTLMRLEAAKIADGSRLNGEITFTSPCHVGLCSNCGRISATRPMSQRAIIDILHCRKNRKLFADH